MIEFMKKWVTKEKALINDCLQALLLPESAEQKSIEIETIVTDDSE